MLLAAAADAGTKFAQIDVEPWVWAATIAAILAMLAFDVIIVHRNPHEPVVREALIESAAWIGVSIVFGILVWNAYGSTAGTEYFTGYVIEKSLSVDNVFVWAVILSYFRIPGKYQFRVLFYGVLGALVLRAIFIFAGVALIERAEWVLYVFGAILLYGAYNLLGGHGEADPTESRVYKLITRFIPSTNEIHGQKLFVIAEHGVHVGKRVATPMFIVLLLVEATDVVFAVDSVPAILAISREPFIVFTSNAFAILGLRALYFALAGLKDKFVHLDKGLAVILAYVGVKILLQVHYGFHIDAVVSLSIVLGILTVAIVASLRASDAHPDLDAPPPDPSTNQPEEARWGGHDEHAS